MPPNCLLSEKKQKQCWWSFCVDTKYYVGHPMLCRCHGVCVPKPHTPFWCQIGLDCLIVNQGATLPSKSWLELVNIDCILLGWLLEKGKTGPKCPYSACYVYGHYTCLCMVHLLLVELQACMHCRLMQFYGCAGRLLSATGLKTAWRPHSAGP